MLIGIHLVRRPAAAPAAAPRPPVPMYARGETIRIPGVDFARTDRTVVFVIKQGCVYCDRSMPFYKSITTNGRPGGRVRMVAVAPDVTAVTQLKLGENGVRFDEVLQLPLGQLKIRGTPTVILVNRSGVVENIWTGLLDDKRQQELLAALGKAS